MRKNTAYIQRAEQVQRSPSAFTLIELLVVLTIIAMLAGLLLPAVTRTLRSGQAAGCGSNARQIALALVTFDNDYQHMPWLNEGYYDGQFDSTGLQTNSTFKGTNWNNKLVIFKYLPSGFNKGVWLCPGASRAEITGLDLNGNPANYGGYGVSWNIFRDENSKNATTFANIPQRPLRLSRIPRPDRTWLVGDCGRPEPQSEPGSGFYFRTANAFGYPSQRGLWDFTKAYTDPQPALRHNNEARWAAFDTHVTKLDWEGMQGETNNFTARGESL